MVEDAPKERITLAMLVGEKALLDWSSYLHATQQAFDAIREFFVLKIPGISSSECRVCRHGRVVSCGRCGFDAATYRETHESLTVLPRAATSHERGVFVISEQVGSIVS